MRITRSRLAVGICFFLAGALVTVAPSVASAVYQAYVNSNVPPDNTYLSSLKNVTGGRFLGLFGAGGTGYLGTIQGHGVIASTTAPNGQYVYLNHATAVNARSYCGWNRKLSTSPADPEFLDCRVQY